jgi:Gene product 70
MKLEVVHPTFLIAVGDTERLEVFRSPVVREDDSWVEPVHQFIKDHGLVPAISESFDDPDWMSGRVEVTVYAPAPVGVTA